MRQTDIGNDRIYLNVKSLKSNRSPQRRHIFDLSLKISASDANRMRYTETPAERSIHSTSVRDSRGEIDPFFEFKITSIEERPEKKPRTAENMEFINRVIGVKPEANTAETDIIPGRESLMTSANLFDSSAGSCVTVERKNFIITEVKSDR